MQVYEESSGRSGRRRGLFAFVVAALVAVLGFVAPGAAWAAEGDVAQIGTTTYATLDEAITAASDGATIELLGDATTDGMNLSKDLIIAAADDLESTPTVTFEEYGIALWGVDLTFKDCNVVMTGIGSTPYTAEWSWMSICASVNATLTLDSVTMTMDATGTTNSPHAIYFCNNNVLNLVNGTTLTIKNYGNDALEWDGGDEGYNVNITDSTFISDSNRSGFTGTFYATITNSTVDVINSSGNGSNGSHFIIKDSEVNFSNNGSHGLSTGVLEISNSIVTAEDNGGMGITVNNNLKIENDSVVTVTGNCNKTNTSYSSAAMRLYNDYDFTVDGTSELYINNNYNTGLYVRQGNLSVEDGAVLEITGNTVNNTLLDGYGGGLYVGYGANYDPTVTLPSDAKIYNNHAATAGDDIYVSAGVEGPSLTFGATGSDWSLDGTGIGGVEDDCTDAIDGWYLDGMDKDGALDANKRWETHADSYDDVYAELYVVDGETTVKGLLALKAAHGIESAEATLGATKILEGADIADYAFTFGLLDEEGNVLQAVTNDAGGSVSFDVLEFSEKSTYKYKISEVNDGQDGIVYDETVYGVTVDVKWDGEGACFVAEVTVEGSDDDTVTFTNTYETEETVTPGDDETTDGTAAEEEASSSDILPQTGDPVNIAAVVAVAAIAAVVAAISLGVLLTRRRG